MCVHQASVTSPNSPISEQDKASQYTCKKILRHKTGPLFSQDDGFYGFLSHLHAVRSTVCLPYNWITLFRSSRAQFFVLGARKLSSLCWSIRKGLTGVVTDNHSSNKHPREPWSLASKGIKCQALLFWGLPWPEVNHSLIRESDSWVIRLD